MGSTQGPSRTAPFFLTAWGISWAALLPTILAQRGVLSGPPERYMPLALFAVLSPMLAAMLVSRFEPGGAGVRAVFRPLRNWRVSPAWYLVALALPGAVLLAGVVVYRLAGGTGMPGWVFPPTDAQRVVALFMIPLGEEIGWRGFALPRLQQRHSRLAASGLLGVGWGVWHLPMFLMQGINPGVVWLVLLVFFVPGSVMFSWLHNRTGGSLPIAIAAHVGVHLNNSQKWLPSVRAPLYVHVVAATVLAVVLVVADRRAWSAPPDAREA